MPVAGDDIFGATPTFGGAFSMDEASLTFATPGTSTSNGGLGLLVQSVDVQYTRPIQRIFELSNQKTTYYVAGRSEGRMQISRLAAPKAVTAEFLETFANICNVKSNTLVIDATPGVKDCGGDTLLADPEPSRYQFSFCLVESVQFRMTVQSLALTENMGMVFAKMAADFGNDPAVQSVAGA